LPEGTLERLASKIESIWTTSGAWPDYVEVMRQALSARSPDDGAKQPASRLDWVLIPNICCSGVGGDPEWADEISLAWWLFNIAAHVFDSVEDMDKPEAWWQDTGPAVGLNAASGLFFTASLALSRLYQGPVGVEAANAIDQRFYSQLMQMSAGQHLDLTLAYLTLENYWKIAAGKSGSFFSLASWSGSRLACRDETRLEGFTRYGHHFGMLVQLLDDLQDFREIQNEVERTIEPKALTRSFASAYALDVLEGEEKNHLEHLLGQLSTQPEMGDQNESEALEIIEGCGAALYLTIEVERHRSLALAALEEANPAVTEREQLIDLLPNLQSI
jgi:geranylgeranyl pyrophosphate synthase